MKKIVIVIGLVAAMITPFTANAETTSFSGSGAYGNAHFVSDTCHEFYYGYIYVFEYTNKSKSVKTGNAGAYIAAYGTNVCTNSDFDLSGSVDGISFTKDAKGKTITAAGSVPVYEFYADQTIDVNFDITFTQISDSVLRAYGTTHAVSPDGNKLNHHYDDTYSSATVTGTGTASDSVAGSHWDVGFYTEGQTGTSKVHQVDITRN